MLFEVGLARSVYRRAELPARIEQLLAQRGDARGRIAAVSQFAGRVDEDDRDAVARGDGLCPPSTPACPSSSHRKMSPASDPALGQSPALRALLMGSINAVHIELVDPIGQQVEFLIARLPQVARHALGRRDLPQFVNALAHAQLERLPGPLRPSSAKASAVAECATTPGTRPAGAVGRKLPLLKSSMSSTIRSQRLRVAAPGCCRRSHCRAACGPPPRRIRRPRQSVARYGGYV